MTPLQSPRGTRDILPSDNLAWQRVTDACQAVARQLGYGRITLPTFEETALFQRSLGQGTDIIDKEMFLVQGRSEEASVYALRPEGTAGMVRAYVQHGMQTWPQPVRLYSVLNLFRYERPQRGRYREHVQFDVECFGDASPFADAWTIFTHWLVLKRLGVTGVTLEINTLGSNEERVAYKKALVRFLEPQAGRLSEDSRRRLAQNPLRILDSKDPDDREIVKDAPLLTESLGEATLARLEEICHYLEAWGIPFRRNPFLVRGLDYYSHTCFEWVHEGEGGKVLSVGGGGRYDSLVTQLGGPDVGAVGAGLGLDRIVDLLPAEEAAPVPDAYVAVGSPEFSVAGAKLLDRLVSFGLRVDADFGRSFNAQMKAANRTGSRFAALVLEPGKVAIKDMGSGQQREVSPDELGPDDFR